MFKSPTEVYNLNHPSAVTKNKHCIIKVDTKLNTLPTDYKPCNDNNRCKLNHNYINKLEYITIIPTELYYR